MHSSQRHSQLSGTCLDCPPVPPRIKKISVRASPQTASDLLSHVHRVASLLKRWLLGTHQGAVHPEQLDFYLDEFTFRFDRRDSKARGMLFYQLLYGVAGGSVQECTLTIARPS